jgi:hypothetical protein
MNDCEGKCLRQALKTRRPRSLMLNGAYDSPLANICVSLIGLRHPRREVFAFGLRVWMSLKVLNCRQLADMDRRPPA